MWSQSKKRKKYVAVYVADKDELETKVSRIDTKL
jgi:uncharacterized protein YlbG (UPF0298 family)